PNVEKLGCTWLFIHIVMRGCDNYQVESYNDMDGKNFAWKNMRNSLFQSSNSTWRDVLTDAKKGECNIWES
ncbi:hypothetical protein LOAG_06528, partial [Loa loa]